MTNEESYRRPDVCKPMSDCYVTTVSSAVPAARNEEEVDDKLPPVRFERRMPLPPAEVFYKRAMERSAEINRNIGAT